MEKIELLNVLYNERQRLATKYSSPGWNKWVLYGALISCALYFFDLLGAKPFKWIPVIIIVICLSEIALFIRYLSIIYFKNKKLIFSQAERIKKIKIEMLFFYAIVMVINIILLRYMLLKPLASSSVEIKFSLIIFAFLVTLYLCTTLKNSDLLNIDYLIDQTILNENPDVTSTLNIMQAIKLDYSLNTVFKSQITEFIKNKEKLYSTKEKLSDLFAETEYLHKKQPEEMKKFIQDSYILIDEMQNTYNTIYENTINLFESIVQTSEYISKNKTKTYESKALISTLLKEKEEQHILSEDCSQLIRKATSNIENFTVS